MEYTYYSSTTETNNILASLGVGSWLAIVALAIFDIIVTWIIFEKAGQKGWAAIIPIYNLIVLLRVVKLDWWHILIWIFVPFATIAYAIIVPIKLAKVFGKSTAFGVLTIFFPIITEPIIAFGQATYEG